MSFDNSKVSNRSIFGVVRSPLKGSSQKISSSAIDGEKTSRVSHGAFGRLKMTFAKTGAPIAFKASIKNSSGFHVDVQAVQGGDEGAIFKHNPLFEDEGVFTQEESDAILAKSDQYAAGSAYEYEEMADTRTSSAAKRIPSTDSAYEEPVVQTCEYEADLATPTSHYEAEWTTPSNGIGTIHQVLPSHEHEYMRIDELTEHFNYEKLN